MPHEGFGAGLNIHRLSKKVNGHCSVKAIYAAVPTAKTVYIPAGEYRMEDPLVAATVSITTQLSVATLLCWLYVFFSSLA